MQVEKTINLTVDGVDYPVDSFSETVQRLVAIHSQWRQDLAEERLAVAKTEAAIRAVDQELAQNVAAELAQRNAAANDAAPE
jgi:hypothetical protein